MGLWGLRPCRATHCSTVRRPIKEPDMEPDWTCEPVVEPLSFERGEGPRKKLTD